MPEEQFVFHPSYLAQSCDQSQYENYDKMIIKNIDVFDKLVGDIQLMLAEKKRVDPAVLSTKLATDLDRITELEEQVLYITKFFALDYRPHIFGSLRYK